MNVQTVHRLATRYRVRLLRCVLGGMIGGLLSACVVAAPTSLQARSSHTAVPGEITYVRVSRIDSAGCDRAPVTFGQTFAVGDLPQGQTLRAVYAGKSVPSQTEIKARHPDGSARHAVITLDAPCTRRGADVSLVATPDTANDAPAMALGDVLGSDFDTGLRLNIDGQTWHADARALLKSVEAAGGCAQAGKRCTRWLSGPLASEWVVNAPLENSQGDAHPYLQAYFSVRAYGPAPVKRVRTDVIVENAWAYGADSTNVKYAATIQVAGQPDRTLKPFTHYRHARWHQPVWWGASQSAPLYAALDPAYLQASRAVPRYENVRISNNTVAKARQHCRPMHSCDQSSQMQITGAQGAIGPLPRWSAAYVIQPDYRLYRWMLANTDAMGAYGIHFRSQDTGDVMSVEAHPCATMVYPARVARCQAPPHGDDRFPRCKSKDACETPLNADVAHHPAPAYVAYLATGDWYYMSEMTFWADWVAFWQNPEYRNYADALVHQTQLRGQAWSLRTLGDAAYLLPDDAPMKDYFNRTVANNIQWYNKKYAQNSKANKLGLMDSYHAVIYPSHGKSRTGVATWQSSFFTWATGNLADQGFAGAKAMRDYFSQFQVGTMTAPGFCWELASSYHVRVRDSRKSPIYDSFAQVYDKSFPDLKGTGCAADAVNAALTKSEGKKRFHYPPGTMVGYPKSGTGFVANFQVGLAAAAESSLPDAKKAWSIFAQRNTKTNYSSNPQFAVVPRTPLR